MLQTRRKIVCLCLCTSQREYAIEIVECETFFARMQIEHEMLTTLSKSEENTKKKTQTANEIAHILYNVAVAKHIGQVS